MVILMYVICAYDVDEKRGTKIKKILRKYLFHVQRSVFEGELTPSVFERLKEELDAIIIDQDEILFYFVYNHKQIYKNSLGRKKDISNIID